MKTNLKIFAPALIASMLLLGGCSKNETPVNADKVIENFTSNIAKRNYVVKADGHLELTVRNADEVFIYYEGASHNNEAFFTVNEDETFHANIGGDAVSDLTYFAEGKAVDAAAEICLDTLLEVSEGNLMNLLYNDPENPLRFVTTDSTKQSVIELFAKVYGYGDMIYSRIQNFEFTFADEKATSLKIFAEVTDDGRIVYEDIDLFVTFGNAEENAIVHEWMANPTYPAGPTAWDHSAQSIINSVFDQEFGDVAYPFPARASYTLQIDHSKADTQELLYAKDKYATAKDLEDYIEILTDNGFTNVEGTSEYRLLLRPEYNYYSSVTPKLVGNQGMTIEGRKYFDSPKYHSFEDINAAIQTKDYPAMDETTAVKSWAATDDWARAKVAGWYFWDYDMYLDVLVEYDDLAALEQYLKSYTDKLLAAEFKYLEGENYYASADTYYSFRYADYGNGLAGMLFKHEHRMTASELGTFIQNAGFPALDLTAAEAFSGRDMADYFRYMTNSRYSVYVTAALDFETETKRDAFLDRYVEQVEDSGYAKIDDPESAEYRWGDQTHEFRIKVAGGRATLTFIKE